MTPAELFASIEEKYRLPTGYLGRTWQMESASGRNLYNPKSGAAGHFQFIPRTAKAYGDFDPYDLAQSADAAARLAVDNRAAMQRAGIESPDASQLYLAHQQGAKGALNLMRSQEPATSVVGEKAVLWNAGKEGQTGADFASAIRAKFGGFGSSTPTRVASADEKSLTQFGGLLSDRMGVLGQRLGILGGSDGGKVPFDSELPYSPPFQAPTQQMGAQFSGPSPMGGVGSVGGGASAALTSRPLPKPEAAPSLTPDQMRGFASLGTLGMALMAAGAPKQTWTPGPPPPAVRGKWRDDIFAGLLG